MDEPRRPRLPARGRGDGAARAALRGRLAGLRAGLVRGGENRRRGRRGEPRGQARRGRVLPELHARAGGGGAGLGAAGGPGGARALSVLEDRLHRLRPGGDRARPRGSALRESRRRGAQPARRRAHPPRRCGGLALHLRLDGFPQGRGSPPPRLLLQRRDLRRADPEARPRRHLRRGAEALLRLRVRQQPALPLPRWRDVRALPREEHGRAGAGGGDEAQGHRAL